MKIRTFATGRRRQPLLHQLGSLDHRGHLPQLPSSHRAQVLDRPGAISGLTSEQVPDVIERQARAPRGVDDGEPAHRGIVVSTLAAAADGLGKKPDLFVIADRGRAPTGQPREFPDGQQIVWQRK